MSSLYAIRELCDNRSIMKSEDDNQTSVDKQIAGMRSQLDGLNNRLNHLDTHLTVRDRAESRRQNQLDGISAKLAEHDDQFAKHTKHLTSIDKRLDSIDKRFAQVDERFAQVDKRFDKNDEAMKKMFIYFSNEDAKRDAQHEETMAKMDKLLTVFDGVAKDYTTLVHEEAASAAVSSQHRTELDDHEIRLTKLERARA